MMLFLSMLHAFSATPIDQVVVYSDRAQVTRLGPTTCSKGQARILFSELPAGLLVNTLRANTNNSAQVIGIEIERETLIEPLNKDIVKLDAEITSLTSKKMAIQYDLQVISQRQQKITQYRAFFSKQLQEAMLVAPNTKQWTENLDTIQAEELSMFEKTHTFGLELADINEKITILNDQKSRLHSNPQREVIHANVLLQCTEKSTSVSLSYVVPQATWKPEYDVQYVHNDKKTFIRTAVIVRQSTGEDWTNAKLILSTANPQLGSRAPYPKPILVYGELHTEPKQLLSKAEDQSRLSSGGYTAQESSIDISEQGTMLEMHLPQKVDIISNGHPYWLPLDEHTAPSEAKLMTIPKMAPYVYQTISFFNPSTYPILEGNIQVQRNGTYMGQHPISYTASKEPMEISLGTDSRFRIEYKPIIQKKENQKLFDPKKNLNKAFQISVSNLTDQQQTIEVRDQIPISKHEKITVHMGEKTSAGYHLNPETGLLFWNLTLEPSQSKELVLYYTIQIPEEWK